MNQPEPQGYRERTTYSNTCPWCKAACTFQSTEQIERWLIWEHIPACMPSELETVKQWALDGKFLDQTSVLPPSAQPTEIGPTIIPDPDEEPEA